MPSVTFMISNLTVKDAPHSSLIKAVIAAKLGKICSTYNVSIGAVKLKWFTDFLRIIPALGDAIPHIIGLSSKEKMVWAHASWVIASVTNIKFFIKRAVCHFVNNSSYSSPLATVFPSKENKAISSFLPVTCPNPARFRFLHFIPYTLGQRLAFHAGCNKTKCRQSQIINTEVTHA